jgi:hypothetical protein
MSFDELTPVEQYGDCWAKRDDMFSIVRHDVGHGSVLFGSGVSLSGVLYGVFDQASRLKCKVVGFRIGSDPSRILARLRPPMVTYGVFFQRL